MIWQVVFFLSMKSKPCVSKLPPYIWTYILKFHLSCKSKKEMLNFELHPHIPVIHTKILVYGKGAVINHIKAPAIDQGEFTDLWEEEEKNVCEDEEFWASPSSAPCKKKSLNRFYQQITLTTHYIETFFLEFLL